MHTFGEVLGIDLRSPGHQPAIVLVSLRKTGKVVAERGVQREIGAATQQ